MSDIQSCERVQQSEYDGTAEGLNLLIDRCGLNRDDFHVMNIDPAKHESTNKFTGHIMINQFIGKERHRLAGLYLKPGDYYIHEPDEELNKA